MSRLRCRRVYPRECGGTRHLYSAGVRGRGLSPRVRGNRTSRIHGIQSIRSIPASAGEPTKAIAPNRIQTVYPRECGGTKDAFDEQKADEGLSPRVRGNLPSLAPRQKPRGSIPASAGEPAIAGATAETPRVYPRECGGTLQDQLSEVRLDGLSPRVRGNQGHPISSIYCCRSIPASAGEPKYTEVEVRAEPVYPRELRGNLQPSLDHFVGKGSIPASAGEPASTNSRIG